MASHRVVPSASALNGEGGSSFEAGAEASLRRLDFARGRWALGSMVGRSSAMERLFLQMRYLANHLRLVLLEGEPGTGKRLAARTLHDLSPHRSAPFVVSDAGRFLTGGDIEVRLAEAQGGTLYLTGIEALNHDQQVRLQHLLGWLAQAGSPRTFAGPVIAPKTPAFPRALLLGSSRALRSLVLYGKFRGELHAQLSAAHMVLPPLRERREDIPMLVDVFLKRLALPLGAKRLRGFAPDLLPALLAQRWPGNVAELQAALTTAALRCGGEWLRARDLPVTGEPSLRSDLRPGSQPAAPEAAPLPAVWTARPGEGPRLQPRVQTGGPSRPGTTAVGGGGPFGPGHDEGFDPNLDRAILRHIRRVLGSVNGNKLRAARLLGISRSTLYRLLESEAARPEDGTSSGIAV